jgi:hypothetical protein
MADAIELTKNVMEFLTVKMGRMKPIVSKLIESRTDSRESSDCLWTGIPVAGAVIFLLTKYFGLSVTVY